MSNNLKPIKKISNSWCLVQVKNNRHAERNLNCQNFETHVSKCGEILG